MKLPACLLIAAACLSGAAATAQTYDRENRLIAAAERKNVAAAQVAVAQARLFGSMLLSYSADDSGVARIAIATRSEMKVIEVDPENFDARIVRRIPTKNALPKGAVVCRSYAPIDAILAAGKARFGVSRIDVLPPHRIEMPWRVRASGRLWNVSFDKRGQARFSAAPG